MIHFPPNPEKAGFSHSGGGPQGVELARMQSLWNAAGAILTGRGEPGRLWASHSFTNFRDGKLTPLDVARASDAGLAEALAYLEQSRERLLDWGWAGEPSIWQPKPKRRKQVTWTWTPRPRPE